MSLRRFLDTNIAVANAANKPANNVVFVVSFWPVSGKDFCSEALAGAWCLLSRVDWLVAVFAWFCVSTVTWFPSTKGVASLAGWTGSFGWTGCTDSDGLFGLVVTETVTWSFDPSGYVTVTGTYTVPGVLPFGNVLGLSTFTFGAGLSLG